MCFLTGLEQSDHAAWRGAAGQYVIMQKSIFLLCGGAHDA